MKMFPIAACALVLSASALAQQAATPAATSQQAAAAPQAPAIPPPANPITAAQIKELESVSGVADMEKRFTTEAQEYYQRQLPPFMPQDVVDDLSTGLKNLDLPSQSASIYSKYLSTEDAAKIIDFYKTPAGRHYMTAQPVLMSDLQHSWLQATQTTVKGVVTKHKEEIEAAQKKYVDEHSQPKPSLNTPAPGASSSAPHTATPPQK